jgi:acetyl esterase
MLKTMKMNYSTYYIKALFLVLLFSYSFTFCIGQEKTSLNEEKLQSARLKYPYADYNSDGVLTGAEFSRYMKMQDFIRDQQKKLSKMPDRMLADHSYGPHWRNTLDFWKAPSEKPTPVLIFWHGGGFVGGDKSLYYGDSLAIACLENGISVVTANYRYVTQSSFPGPFLDAARVIQYVRYHAKEWGIDPNRIATTGSSAGGNLSVWFATHDDLACPNNPDPVLRESTRLTTIIAKNAQTSNDPFFWMENIYSGDAVHTSIYDFYGVDYMDFGELKEIMSEKKYREMAIEASALNHITKDDPPAFLIHPERPEEWDGKPLPPGTKQSKYTHHVAFGEFFRKEYEKLGLKCRLNGQQDVSVEQEINWLKKYFNLN